MAERTQHNALLGMVFSLDTGYTDPVVGDKVAMSGDYEVAAASADDFVLGEVFAINEGAGNVGKTVTVEMRSQKVDASVASGAGIVAGAYVKIAGANLVALHVAGTDDAEILYGIALADAANTEAVDVMVL